MRTAIFPTFPKISETQNMHNKVWSPRSVK